MSIPLPLDGRKTLSLFAPLLSLVISSKRGHVKTVGALAAVYLHTNLTQATRPAAFCPAAFLAAFFLATQQTDFALGEVHVDI